MTSNESSTRRSFNRTGSTNDRRVVSTAGMRSGGLHVTASGDSGQQRVVDGPPSSLIVSDVAAVVVDVIPDCAALTQLRGLRSDDSFVRQNQQQLSQSYDSQAANFLNESLRRRLPGARKLSRYDSQLAAALVRTLHFAGPRTASSRFYTL